MTCCLNPDQTLMFFFNIKATVYMIQSLSTVELLLDRLIVINNW